MALVYYLVQILSWWVAARFFDGLYLLGVVWVMFTPKCCNPESAARALLKSTVETSLSKVATNVCVFLLDKDIPIRVVLSTPTRPLHTQLGLALALVFARETRDLIGRALRLDTTGVGAAKERLIKALEGDFQWQCKYFLSDLLIVLVDSRLVIRGFCTRYFVLLSVAGACLSLAQALGATWLAPLLLLFARRTREPHELLLALTRALVYSNNDPWCYAFEMVYQLVGKWVLSQATALHEVSAALLVALYAQGMPMGWLAIPLAKTTWWYALWGAFSGWSAVHVLALVPLRLLLALATTKQRSSLPKVSIQSHTLHKAHFKTSSKDAEQSGVLMSGWQELTNKETYF